MTTGAKNLKVRCGRISRVLKLPTGLHKKIKILAKSQSITVSELHDQMIERFSEEKLGSKQKIGYLFPQGELEKINIPFKENLVVDILKKISIQDAVPENRIIYTAIMRFVDGILDKNTV